VKHHIHDHSGHTTIEYDTADPAMLEAADAKFMELVTEHKKTAATRKAGAKDYTVIKSPDQQQDETMFISPYQAG